MEKRRKFAYFVLIVTALALTGCSASDIEKQSQAPSVPMKGNNVDVEKFQAYYNEQQAKITELEGQVQTEKTTADQAKNESLEAKKIAEEKISEADNMKEELEYYKTYVKETTSLLTTEQRQTLIDKEWSYTASINGIALPSNGVLDIRESNFSVNFTEERVKFSVLPEADSLKGKISTPLIGSISIAGHTPTENVDGTKTTLTFSFKELNVGDTVLLEIKDDLMKRLNLTTNKISVTVVK